MYRGIAMDSAPHVAPRWRLKHTLEEEKSLATGLLWPWSCLHWRQHSSHCLLPQEASFSDVQNTNCHFSLAGVADPVASLIESSLAPSPASSATFLSHNYSITKHHSWSSKHSAEKLNCVGHKMHLGHLVLASSILFGMAVWGSFLLLFGFIIWFVFFLVMGFCLVGFCFWFFKEIDFLIWFSSQTWLTCQGK